MELRSIHFLVHRRGDSILDQFCETFKHGVRVKVSSGMAHAPTTNPRPSWRVAITWHPRHQGQQKTWQWMFEEDLACMATWLSKRQRKPHWTDSTDIKLLPSVLTCMGRPAGVSLI